MTNSSLFGDAELSAASSVTAVSATRGQTQSLYRKYRPQSFDASELVGQEHIVRTLQNAIAMDRVAHAYLFCGPRGTGKTTTARVLAKAANCLDSRVNRRPCNACVSCVAIATGATADVIEIDAASNRGIDDIRELRERVKFAPTHLRYKFYIIDEAHQITGAAANAFLKTLEEPPAHTKFILATTDPEELLPTIVSRCQRFDFRRVTAEAMVARLRTVADAERLSIDDDALRAVARHSTGSLRDALGMLDQLAVFIERDEKGSALGSVAESDVLTLLGVSHNDRVESLAGALAAGDAAAALGAVNASVEAGEDPRQLNRQLIGYLRVLLHERAGGTPDADERAKELARRFELPRLTTITRILSETDIKIRHSSFPHLPLELALLDAIVNTPVHRVPTAAIQAGTETPAAIDPLAAPPTTALKERLRSSSRPASIREEPPAEETDTSPQPPILVRIQPPASGSSDALEISQIADLWPMVRADVKAVNRRVEALLASVDPIAIRASEITLATPYDFHRKRLNDDEIRRVVEEALGRHLLRPVTVVCVLRSEVDRAPLPDLGPPLGPQSTHENGSERAGADDSIDEQRIRAAKNIFDAEEITS